MPLPTPDRQTLMESARALYIEGNRQPKEISEELRIKLNTLMTWIRRGGWSAIKRDVQAKLKQCSEITKVKQEIEAVPSLRLELAKAAQVQLEVLNSRPPRKYSELAGRDGYASTLKTIVESVSKIEAWDAQDGLKLNLGLLSSFQLPPPVEPSSQVIDVEAATQEKPN